MEAHAKHTGVLVCLDMRTKTTPPKTTPPLKTSIYLDEETKQILAAREVGPGTRSEVIRSCVMRYAETCRRERPDLTVAEWRTVVEILNPKWLAAGHSAIHVPATLEDVGTTTGKALGKKTKDMFFSELVAIVDEAERYWAAKASGEKPKLPGEK
jgi:hypothetical protein